MSQQNAATAEPEIAPSVHVWMTVEDAARTLRASPALLSCQIELGELESRLNDGGVAEVLIALPPRSAPPETAERVGVSIVADKLDRPDARNAGADTIPTFAGALVPMLQSMRQAQREELRGARRSARLAWTLAVIMVLGVSAGSTLGVRALAVSRQQVTDLGERVHETGAEMTAVAAERDALRSRLTEAREAAARIEGELAVERQVEDTLFKSALSTHASARGEPNAAAFANGAD